MLKRYNGVSHSFSKHFSAFNVISRLKTLFSSALNVYDYASMLFSISRCQ
jgi:hypothetical protein